MTNVRELKTRQEISDWLTRELRACPDCEDARVRIQYELIEPDADGCNWSRDIVINSGRSDSVIVKDCLRPIFEQARRGFNVQEP